MNMHARLDAAFLRTLPVAYAEKMLANARAATSDPSPWEHDRIARQLAIQTVQSLNPKCVVLVRDDMAERLAEIQRLKALPSQSPDVLEELAAALADLSEMAGIACAEVEE